MCISRHRDSKKERKRERARERERDGEGEGRRREGGYRAREVDRERGGVGFSNLSTMEVRFKALQLRCHTAFGAPG